MFFGAYLFFPHLGKQKKKIIYIAINKGESPPPFLFWEISTKSVFLRSRVAAYNASQHGRLMVRRQLLLQHKNKTDNNQQLLPLNDHCQM